MNTMHLIWLAVLILVGVMLWLAYSAKVIADTALDAGEEHTAPDVPDAADYWQRRAAEAERRFDDLHALFLRQRDIDVHSEAARHLEQRNIDHVLQELVNPPHPKAD